MLLFMVLKIQVMFIVVVVVVVYYCFYCCCSRVPPQVYWEWMISLIRDIWMTLLNSLHLTTLSVGYKSGVLGKTK